MIGVAFPEKCPEPESGRGIIQQLFSGVVSRTMKKIQHAISADNAEINYSRVSV
jgi:hypothetical protein